MTLIIERKGIEQKAEPFFGLKVASKGTWDGKRYGNLEQHAKNGAKITL